MLLPTYNTRRAFGLRHWQSFSICLLASAAWFSSPLAWALNSDRQQPIEITADSVELNEGEGFSIYSGNVIITQGTMKIDASRVKITFSDDGLDSMLATEGNHGGLAYMRQESEPTGDGKGDIMEAWGKSIDYQLNSEYLTLLGSAKLIQKGNQFSGHEILFDIPAENVKATGDKGKQVKMIFLPKSK